MAAPKLPFLYPNLFRSVRSCEPVTIYRPVRCPLRTNNGSHQCFHSSQAHGQDTPHQRYGPAAEPRLPPPPKPKGGALQSEHKSRRKSANKTNNSQPRSSNGSSERAGRDSTKQSSSDAGPLTNSKISGPGARRSGTNKGPDSKSDEESKADSESANASEDDPLPQFFRVSESQIPPVPTGGSLPPATVSNPEGQKPPPLSPPPYVHHFDTYTLVKDLEKGGFSEHQSVSIMKAVRGLLADNLDIARGGLVSKSDVENETYLFRAASSELRNSIQASRNSEIQAQRSQRAQLQHEFDILSQRMTQELMSLKDDLKEMFNDQKISTRELQRSLDTAIQELNYQITVSLNSDGKSEVEGLRWILTRRAALAIATSAGKQSLLPYIPVQADNALCFWQTAFAPRFELEIG